MPQSFLSGVLDLGSQAPSNSFQMGSVGLNLSGVFYVRNSNTTKGKGTEIWFEFEEGKIKSDRNFDDIYCVHIYISRRCNSWVRFRVQKLGILDTQIQMGVSQRVFIPSRASKYMLDSKHKSFRKWKNIEVGQFHFEVLATSKNTQYIYFIYTLWGAIVGSEVAQLQKQFFLRIH